MKDKEQDVFVQAAAQMHKAFPPIVQTVTQAKADLERLYPKGGDGKSTTVKMQTSTGEDVQVVLAENAGSGKGKSFLPETAQPVPQAIMDAILAKPLLAFTVGNEDIFAAADKAQALALANTLTKPVPAYVLGDVVQVKDQFLNRPWGKSKDTLQQRLDARSEPGYLAGWQD